LAKPPEEITIPSGTVFSVRMIDSIDSAQSHAGDEFAATVATPVVVGDRVVIPRNSDARVRLVQAKSAGRMSGRSELKVELVSVRAGGQTYQLETGYYEQAGASRGTRTAEAVGGGAVLGALIGAIAGRGKGAAIGAVLYPPIANTLIFLLMAAVLIAGLMILRISRAPKTAGET
jgi:hypothetical protein